MRRTGWSLSLAVVLSLGFPSPARASETAANTAAQDPLDQVFAHWRNPQAPGCVVGVSRTGRPDEVRAYGSANLDHGLPLRGQSVFLAASVSKQFTAFAIALLAQQGKLSLDDDIRHHLPEMPDYGTPIRIGQLMHHTSGLREQGQLLSLAGWRPADLYAQQDMLKAISRQSALNFIPGSEVVYGNSAYTLLATVVERVSGQTFDAFTQAHIFQPLGMRQSRFQSDHNDLVANRATAYSPLAQGGWRVNVPAYDHYGSSNLYTSVPDLLIWQRNLRDGKVGGAEVRKLMQTSGALNDGTVIGYGGGLMLADYRGLPSIGHDGMDGGYRSDTLWFPQHGLAVVALCNASTAAAELLTRQVADHVLDASLLKPYPAAQPQLAAAAATWAGTYWSPRTDEVLRLEFAEGGLRMRGAPTALVPIGADRFRPGESAHMWQFGRAADGRTTLAIRDSWPTMRDFVRVQDAPPAAEQLASYAGDYYSPDTGTTYQVRANAGGLTLQWPRRDAVALEPVGGARFVGAVGTVTFLADARRPAATLSISNRRLRRLMADRVEVPAE